MITIDLSSDDDEPIQKETNTAITNTHGRSRNQTSQKSSQNQSCQEFSSFDTVLDYIDHIVMIWLSRVQKGYRIFEMPSNVLKAKATEAATILGVDSIIFPPDWQLRFQRKVKKIFEQGKQINFGQSNSIRIEEIIKEQKLNPFSTTTESNEARGIESKEINIHTAAETRKFQNNKTEDKQDDQLSIVLNQQKKHLEQVRQAQIERIKAQNHENLEYWNQEPMKRITFRNTLVNAQMKETTESNVVSEVIPPRTLPESEVLRIEDILNDPIHTYEEAVDCLELIKNYLVSVRNLNAVLFVNKIEGFLRTHIDS